MNIGKQIIRFAFIASLVGLSSLSEGMATGVSVQDLIGMRENYADWGLKSMDDGSLKPLGDISHDRVINRLKNSKSRLTFSESVSYALFMYALPIVGEDEGKAARRFERIWMWAKNHMQRKNLKEVFYYCNDQQKRTWRKMPEHLRDSLLAWRQFDFDEVEHVPQSASQYIYMAGDDGSDCFRRDEAKINNNHEQWLDGVMSAVDGEILSAYSLIIADKRWPGKGYLNDSMEIIQALRNKAIIPYRKGLLLDMRSVLPEESFFFGAYKDKEEGVVNIDHITNNPITLTGNRFYAGVTLNKSIDIETVESIEFRIRGEGDFNIIMQDEKTSNADPGRFISSDTITIMDKNKTEVIARSVSEFRKFKYSGKQDKPFGDKIKKIQIQTAGTGSSILMLERVCINFKGQPSCEEQSEHLYLSSNDKGALNVNPSYYIFPAFRVFQAVETDENAKRIWGQLIDDGYRLIRRSMNYGNKKTEIFPDWLAIDRATGTETAFTYVKSTGESKEKSEQHEYGWDAFRTLFFVTWDGAFFDDGRGRDIVKLGIDYLQKRMRDNNNKLASAFLEGEPKDGEASPGMLAVYALAAKYVEETDFAKYVEGKLNSALCHGQGKKSKLAWFHVNSEEQLPHCTKRDDYYSNFWGYFASYFDQKLNGRYGDRDDVLKVMSDFTGINFGVVSMGDVLDKTGTRPADNKSNYRKPRSWDLDAGAGQYEENISILSKGKYVWIKPAFRKSIDLLPKFRERGELLLGGFLHAEKGKGEYDSSGYSWSKIVVGPSIKWASDTWGEVRLDVGYGKRWDESENGLYEFEQTTDVINVFAFLDWKERRIKYDKQNRIDGDVILFPRSQLQFMMDWADPSSHVASYDSKSASSDAQDKRSLEILMNQSVVDYQLTDGLRVTPGLLLKTGRVYADDTWYSGEGVSLTVAPSGYDVLTVSTMFVQPAENDKNKVEMSVYLDMGSVWDFLNKSP